MTSWGASSGPSAPPQASKGDPSEGLAHAHQRLEQLYAISKLFASFENVEQTFDPALGIVAKTLPLRSAILIDNYDGHSQIFIWPSLGQSPESIRAVRQHAETAFKYLIGVAATESLDLTEPVRMTKLPWQTEAADNAGNRLLVIPLVVAHRPPFGVLQLEGARPLDKADLMFVNAIANQLAIALDRDRAWRRDIARRQQAEAGRSDAEVRGARAERERTIAQSMSAKYEALATENARLYHQAERAVCVREQILAVVSHDLKTPLTTILMTIDGLTRRTPEQLQEGLPLAITRVRRAAETMLRLIDDLLDVASIEAGHLALQSQAHDPGGMLQETLATFEGIAKAKGLRLTAEFQSNLPQAHCDRDRILQVLSNLVGNASKVTAEGGQVSLRVEARQHEILFTVADDGPGISEQDLEHLFESYWRSGEVGYKGTGLGLAIAKGIVDAHGGQIWSESVLGQGARFIFTVPAAGTGDKPATG